jgi:ADP-ribose pyrophosphatase YjhB (NUDIX family)
MPGRTAARKKDRRPVRRIRTEISAGGIVFKLAPGGILLALMLDPFSKWAFAKGHVEKGETPAEAAVRETGEEMGLKDLRVIAPLGKIDFWFRDRYRPETKGVLIHKYVHYFLMQAPADAKGQPQKKEKIRRVIWLGLRQAIQRSSYRDVLPVLKRASAYLQDRRPMSRPTAIPVERGAK